MVFFKKYFTQKKKGLKNEQRSAAAVRGAECTLFGLVGGKTQGNKLFLDLNLRLYFISNNIIVYYRILTNYSSQNTSSNKKNTPAVSN